MLLEVLFKILRTARKSKGLRRVRLLANVPQRTLRFYRWRQRQRCAVSYANRERGVKLEPRGWRVHAKRLQVGAKRAIVARLCPPQSFLKIHPQTATRHFSSKALHTLGNINSRRLAACYADKIAASDCLKPCGYRIPRTAPNTGKCTASRLFISVTISSPSDHLYVCSRPTMGAKCPAILALELSARPTQMKAINIQFACCRLITE